MLVPAIIQPHLVPFLMDELSKEVLLPGDNKLLRVVRVHRNSSLGLFMYSNVPFLAPNKTLTLCFKPGKGMPRPYDYAYLSTGLAEPCMIKEESVRFLNDFLENMMRTAMVYYVLGRIKNHENKQEVHRGIECFMQRYELYDYDFDMEQYRQMYYRTISASGLLRRFQRYRTKLTKSSR